MDVVNELQNCIVELTKDGVNSKALVRVQLTKILSEVAKTQYKIKKYDEIDKQMSLHKNENLSVTWENIDKIFDLDAKILDENEQLKSYEYAYSKLCIEESQYDKNNFNLEEFSHYMNEYLYKLENEPISTKLLLDEISALKKENKTLIKGIKALNI